MNYTKEEMMNLGFTAEELAVENKSCVEMKEHLPAVRAKCKRLGFTQKQTNYARFSMLSYWGIPFFYLDRVIDLSEVSEEEFLNFGAFYYFDKKKFVIKATHYGFPEFDDEYYVKALDPKYLPKGDPSKPFHIHVISMDHPNYAAMGHPNYVADRANKSDMYGGYEAVAGEGGKKWIKRYGRSVTMLS